jgi:predicted transcriptional regulator YdeE
MTHEIVHLASRTFVGLETRASNAHPELIGELWADFRRRDIAQQVPSKLSDDVFAVYSDYVADHTEPFSLLLGYEAEGIHGTPPGLIRRVVAGGSFARFTFAGNQPDALIDGWRRIWSLGLRRSFRADVECHRVVDPTRVDVLVGIDDSLQSKPCAW